ncbi:hypothetical protein Vadar_008034 [Vaccinium darrowii]|uniref:Uncharacterized protein n=1 Tax=Vaccinium darrowii TaxID=229202 RepID=A0ACB7XXI2_9ERIC|nr:hypothetical protein Vadar_008034 [Vaccinium darrowii]
MPTNTPSSLEIRALLGQVFNYYFCLCGGVAVTTGLAFAHVFVEFAVVEVLITYFTGSYDIGVRDAVGMVNLLDGSSSFLVPVMTYISNNHVSPLKVILCSTAAYITGMVMLCISYFYLIPDDKIRLYFVAAVLFISVGKSGGVLILGNFLFDQLAAHEPRLVKDDGREKARTNVLWTTALLLSTFLTIKFFNYASWSVRFICLTSVMGIGYLLFLCCIPLYHRPEDEANTMEISYAGLEENIPVDEANTMEISRASPEENISVDEDTTIDISYASPGENINNGLVFFAISLVKQWKPLSVMIPMWTTFLVFGLVLSAGDTFFTEQGDSMDQTVSLYTLLLIKKIIYLVDFGEVDSPPCGVFCPLIVDNPKWVLGMGPHCGV